MNAEKTVRARYKRILALQEGGTEVRVIAHNEGDEPVSENQFIRWLDEDWQEIEVSAQDLDEWRSLFV